MGSVEDTLTFCQNLLKYAVISLKEFLENFDNLFGQIIQERDLLVKSKKADSFLNDISKVLNMCSEKINQVSYLKKNLQKEEESSLSYFLYEIKSNMVLLFIKKKSIFLELITLKHLPKQYFSIGSIEDYFSKFQIIVFLKDIKGAEIRTFHPYDVCVGDVLFLRHSFIKQYLQDEVGINFTNINLGIDWYNFFIFISPGITDGYLSIKKINMLSFPVRFGDTFKEENFFLKTCL